MIAAKMIVQGRLRPAADQCPPDGNSSGATADARGRGAANHRARGAKRLVVALLWFVAIGCLATAPRPARAAKQPNFIIIYCDELITTMDLLPTFARLAGTSPPTDRMIDGKDVSDVLLDKPGAASPHEAFYYYFKDRLECVRSGKWKLRVAQVRGGKNVDLPQLFDLEADIGETTDVSARNPDVIARLTKLAEAARADLGDGDQPGKNQRPAGRVDDARALTDAAR